MLIGKIYFTILVPVMLFLNGAPIRSLSCFFLQHSTVAGMDIVV
jgi:hypothetical protein